MTRYHRTIPRITAADAEQEPRPLFVMPEADIPDDLGKAKPMTTNHQTEQPPSTTGRPQPTFTIHAALRDFPIDITFTGEVEQLKAYVARLSEIGATPPPRPSFGGRPPQKPLTQPRYNDAGDPCCTVHDRRDGQPTPLRKVTTQDGRSFWGCPAQSDGTPGETINARGYCDLRFDVKE